MKKLFYFKMTVNNSDAFLRYEKKKNVHTVKPPITFQLGHFPRFYTTFIQGFLKYPEMV